jgi:hypothetical protein
LVVALFLALPGAAFAARTGGASESNSSAPRSSKPGKARIKNGKAIAPSNAPRAVKKLIAAANRIVGKRYKYGGGHGRWEDSGYDCSGTVSYALRGAGLVKRPMSSGEYTSWGRRGWGKWITVYAHGGHMYMMVAGLRLDTGYRDANASRYGTKPGSGPRWNKSRRDARGYRVRHWRGL